MSVYDDLVSRDGQRIWAAAWEVIRSRDRDLLLDLAGRAGEIRKATRDVELGGMLRPNRVALDFALRKLKFYAAGDECPCALYLAFDAYDPEREAQAGNVTLREDVDADGNPLATYRCACTLCGRRYAVVRQEYHYPWWQWSRA